MDLRLCGRAIAVLGILSFVVACSNGTVSQLANTQELRVNIGNEPTTFDPAQISRIYDLPALRLINEALLRPTPDFKNVQNGAADSFSLDSSGTVYTFKLHPGAKWGDGQPVKASDFVYAWQRLLDPRRASGLAFYYTAIKNAAKVNQMDPNSAGVDRALQTLGLAAPDDNTFQVTLEAPAGYFKWVATLWSSAPLRRDVVAKAGKDSTGKELWSSVSPAAPYNVIGNGVYKISDLVPTDHMTFVLNDGYSGTSPKPALTKVTLYEIGDETVAYAKYKAGALDMASVPLAETDAIKSNAGLTKELFVNPRLLMWWINVNTKVAPFDNLAVRQAFAKAIDREAFVNTVLKGRGYPATTLVPKGMRNYRPDLGDAQKFDPSAARAALAASGVSANQLNTMNVKYTYNSARAAEKTIAVFIQDQLKTNLGVTIVLDGADQMTHNRRLYSGNYQIGGPSGWNADYPDSQNWFDIFMSGSNNQLSQWSNKAYDQAVKAADASADDGARDAAYEYAEKALVTDVPVILLYQEASWTVIKPYIRGVSATPSDEFPGDFFFETIQVGQH